MPYNNIVKLNSVTYNFNTSLGANTGTVTWDNYGTPGAQSFLYSVAIVDGPLTFALADFVLPITNFNLHLTSTGANIITPGSPSSSALSVDLTTQHFATSSIDIPSGEIATFVFSPISVLNLFGGGPGAGNGTGGGNPHN